MMSSIRFVKESVDDLWLDLWKDVKLNPQEQKSRDGDIIWEIINANLVITNPTRNLSHNKIRNMSIKYALGEYLWYHSGTNLLAPIQRYTRGWDRMSDDGIHINSNYGHIIKNMYDFNQFELCVNELKQNPNSRRAIIHYKWPFDFVSNPSKDVPCTLTQQFIIRDNRLHTILNMRSNDLWNGIPYDIFFFSCTMIEIAMLLNIEVGLYMHNVGSLHMYKRDYATALENERKCENGKLF